jgi:hypothetical protein
MNKENFFNQICKIPLVSRFQIDFCLLKVPTWSNAVWSTQWYHLNNVGLIRHMYYDFVQNCNSQNNLEQYRNLAIRLKTSAMNKRS